MDMLTETLKGAVSDGRLLALHIKYIECHHVFVYLSSGYTNLLTLIMYDGPGYNNQLLTDSLYKAVILRAP